MLPGTDQVDELHASTTWTLFFFAKSNTSRTFIPLLSTADKRTSPHPVAYAA